MKLPPSFQGKGKPRSEPGPAATPDLIIDWTRARCPFDDQAGDFVCDKATAAGSDRLRFDGTSFKPQGKSARLEHFDF